MKSPSIPEKNGDVSTANHCTLVCRRHPQPVIHEKKSVKNPTCLSETCAKRPIPCATHMRYKTHGYYVGPHSQASTVPVYKQIRQIVCYPSLYRRKCVPSPRASHVPPIASSTLIVTLSWPGHPPLQDRWSLATGYFLHTKVEQVEQKCRSRSIAPHHGRAMATIDIRSPSTIIRASKCFIKRHTQIKLMSSGRVRTSSQQSIQL